MDFVTAGIALFILAQLGIGFTVSRFVTTEDDYLLAGRRLGIPFATFSIFATWFGAESCIGSAGAAYDEGLAGVSSDPFGYGLCILLVGLFFARKFWEMKLVTIADFVRLRYSARAARLCAALMVPTSFLWTAAQIRAFGTILSSTSDITLTAGVVIAASVVIVYTSFGGMFADVLTDFLQGTLLIAGLGVILYFVVESSGGIGRYTEIIAAEAAKHSVSSSFSFWTTAEHWLIPACGSVFAQELISRILSSRSASVARHSSFFAAAMYILIGLIPLSLGLAGAGMMPGLAEGEQILPAMAKRFLPAGMFILFSGAIISAILSTVDSTLLAISALISHNVVPMSRQLPESRKVMVDRMIVIGAGILASFAALSADGVYELVKDASAFGSSGIFVVITVGLFTRYGTERSAVASLAGGALSWIGAYYIFDYELSYLLSLAVAFLLFFLFPKQKTVPSAGGLL